MSTLLKQIEPARAKAVRPDKIPWGDPLWYAEEKLNGWRFLMHFGGGLDRVYLTGRRYSSVTGVLSEKGLCARPVWPLDVRFGYTVLDGEIMAPAGYGFRDIAGIMNVEPEDAERRIAETGPPTFHVFDCLWFDGHDIREEPAVERRGSAGRMVMACQNPLIRMIPKMHPTLDNFDTICAQGGEGVVMKNIAAEYGESGSWIKAKKVVTLDVVVTGFTDAREGKTGKFLGQIGAVLVSVYSSTGELLEVGKVSGMDDETRAHMTENKKGWIGTVVEIACSEFAKDRLFHPRFKRARPEANHRHCTLEKMMQDLGATKNQVVQGPQLSLL